MSPVDPAVQPDRPHRPPVPPEQLADDVRRNDFMLRVAVVLLAFLMACTEIASSSTLVHVASGRHMAGNGVLPPRTDVFSYTAGDAPWINLSWLFDLVAAGVFALSGTAGLTVAKALAAAVVFWLVVTTDRPGVASWWGSVCAALALLACAPQFTATPELVTLLGTALVLCLLNRWQRGSSRLLWALVPVTLLWSNLDPRAFLGLALLAAYLVGEALDSWTGRRPHDRPRLKVLGLAVGASLAASLLHPFFWHVWASPWSLYGDVYPGLRGDVAGLARLSAEQLQSVPMTWPVFWRSALNPHTVAALALLAAALVSMALNRRNVPASHLLAALAALAFALLGAHELAPASVVWAVLATLNAQDWYRAACRQDYSSDRRERIFSLGGRVVTLAGLCVLAYWSVSGRLLGADGPRTGVGLQYRLRAHVDGLEEDLEQAPAEDRGFNFEPAQGDIMIWLGRRPFIDGRMALHNRGGETSTLARHRAARLSLLGQSPAAPSPGPSWREVFDEFGVDYAIPDLTGTEPKYEPFWALVRARVPSSDGSGRFDQAFAPVHIGSATAVLYRADAGQFGLVGDDGDLRNALAFRVAAFREQAGPLPGRIDWPAPPSWYDANVTLPEERRPNAVQRSLHFDEIMRNLQRVIFAEGQSVLLPELAAVAHVGLRNANQGLAEDPSAAAAFHVAGDAYAVLSQVEQIWSAPQGQQIVRDRRFLQAVGALHQALLADPHNPQAPDMLLTLRELYRQHGKLDLALRAAERFDSLVAESREPSAAQDRLVEFNARLSEQLRSQIHQTLTRVEMQIDKTPNQFGHYAAGAIAYQGGCVLRALEEWDKVSQGDLEPDVWSNLEMSRPLLLLEAGRTREAYEALSALEATSYHVPLWRYLTAMALLANGRYPDAIQLWELDVASISDAKLAAVCGMVPLAPAPVEAAGSPLPWAPEHQVLTLAAGLPRIADELAGARLQIALCHLETGDVESARRVLRRILDESPETSLRPLVRNYLQEMTTEYVDPWPPSDRIPIFEGMFAEGDAE